MHYTNYIDYILDSNELNIGCNNFFKFLFYYYKKEKIPHDININLKIIKLIIIFNIKELNTKDQLLYLKLNIFRKNKKLYKLFYLNLKKVILSAKVSQMYNYYVYMLDLIKNLLDLEFFKYIDFNKDYDKYKLFLLKINNPEFLVMLNKNKISLDISDNICYIKDINNLVLYINQINSIRYYWIIAVIRKTIYFDY